MGSKGAGIGSIVVGVAIGALAIAFPPASAGFFYYASVVLAAGSLIAGGAMSIAFNPKAVNASTVKAQDLQIATAAEGIPVPVIFGEQRVIGNFGNYEKQHFRQVKITGRGDGSKGGDQQPAQIIGYDFHLHYEYMLCMGPVDECVQVFSAPGETKMMGPSPTAVGFGSADYVEINLDSVDASSSAGAESGLIRLYRGNPAQVRIVPSDVYNYSAEKKSGPIKAGYTYKIGGRTSLDFTAYGSADNTVGTIFVANNTSGDVLDINNWAHEYTGLNYRSVCWALMIDFKIGRYPQPKSYNFVLRRFPRHDSSFDVKRMDGTTIVGFRARGSADTNKPAYNMANPAAILYEVLTDPVWGRGLPDAIFGDFSTWVSASQYFHARHIGMSMTLDTPDKVFQIVDSVRFHLKTVILWDGETLKLRCLLDLATTHAKIQTLTKAEMKNFRATRALWHSTVNEIRCEFMNKARNYRPDAIHAMDLGNHQITGRLNSARINLPCFTDFNTARRQAFRILRERSYPAMPMQWEMNRFKSQIEVGDVVKIWWDEVDQDSTIYALVTKIEDSDSETDEIKVSAIEDQTLIPAAGHEATPTIPTTAAWERIPDIDQADLQLWTGSTPTVTGARPAMVMEMPVILSRKLYGASIRGAVLVCGQRPATFYNQLYVFFKRSSQSDAAYASGFAGLFNFSIAGELLTDITVDDYWDRSETGFEFELFDATQEEANVLSMFSTCDKITDDLINVLSDTGPYMICQNEMFQIGKVEKVSTNRYRARNFVRGRHSSPRLNRLTGTEVFFVSSLSLYSNVFPSQTPFPSSNPKPTVDEIIDWKMQANTGLNPPLPLDLEFPVRLHHTGTIILQTNNEYFRREADSPLAPTLYDVVDNGGTYFSNPIGTWTVRVRPLFRDQGGGTVPFYTAINQLSNALLNFNYRVVVYDVNDPSKYKELTTVASGAVIGVSVTVTLDPGANPTGGDDNSDSGLVTITPIPKGWAGNEFAGGGQTGKVKIYAVDTTNALISVEDLDLKSQLQL
jgi:hypothetical protein